MQPQTEQLQKYAQVLVNFALNDGNGVKAGDVVYLVTQKTGTPLAKEVYRAILKSGGYPLVQIQDDDFKLIHIEEGTDEQLKFFPEQYYRGLANNIDQYIRILAEDDPMLLANSDARKVIMATNSTKKFRDWLDVKEDAGKFTWTLCLYPTEGAAKEAGLTPEEYWNQIVRACFLDEADPIGKWKSVLESMQGIMNELNEMPVNKVHVEAFNTDLWVSIGENRKWLGGRGRNIPSFEIFTSPDWRGIEGTIFFDLPLYRYGNIIKDITLQLRNGRVVSAKASQKEDLLREMISQKNADKIGEFSLTDKKFSRINRFMANTLFDENFGGEYGNCHLAIGKSYHDTCKNDPKDMTNADYEALGFNESPEHTDIIATTERKVTAVLKDGSTKVIYEGGEFRV